LPKRRCVGGMGGIGEGIAGASISESVPGDSGGQKAWIVLQKYRRTPAFRAILHGSGTRKTPARVACQIRFKMAGCPQGVIVIGPGFRFPRPVLASGQRAPLSKPTTNNCVFPQQLFSPVANQKCSTPEYRDRPGHNTGFSGVSASSQVFPEDVPASCPGAGCLPLGRPGQAIPRLCRIRGRKFHWSWCCGDRLRHGRTSPVA